MDTINLTEQELRKLIYYAVHKGRELAEDIELAVNEELFDEIANGYAINMVTTEILRIKEESQLS